MADYTIKPVADVPDVLGDYPGEMRFLTYEIDARHSCVPTSFLAKPPSASPGCLDSRFGIEQLQLGMMLPVCSSC